MSTGLMTLEEEVISQRKGLESVEVSTGIRGIRRFIVLTKPEITLMVIISAVVACLMTSGSLKLTILLHTVLGTGLLAAGASTLNQYLERALDGRMRRTSRRPLPSGQLTATAALIFGLSLSMAGTIYLFLFLNALTGLLGLFTLISYLFVYTPLKRKTTLCTFVGAVPGAAPILIGWAAANNSLAPEAWTLFAILFFWQFPHFLAIGWLYREDYARAEMLMIPALDTDDGAKTFRLILIYTQVLIIATLLLTFVAQTSTLYFLLAFILGLSFYYVAYRAQVTRSKPAAKRLLHASVIYLALLYIVMALDRLILQTKTK